MNNYTITFDNGTTTTVKTKRNLEAVVACEQADGEHDFWSMHSTRAAAAKFINSARAARALDHETIFGLRKNMTDELREKIIREQTERNARPDRPIRFYIADAVAQD